MTFSLVISQQVAAQVSPEIEAITHELEQAPNAYKKSAIYNKLARQYVYIDLQKAAEQANLGVALSKQYGCVKQLGDLYNSLSIIEIYAGNHSRAFAYIDSTVAVYEYIGFKDGVAGAIGNKGSLYNHNGDYDKALKLQYECLHLYTELGDKSAVATTLTNMFVIFHAQNDFERARITISQAYTLFDELGELDGKAMATYNKAILYSAMDMPDSCLFYSRQCVDFFQQLGNPDDIANGYAIYAIALNRDKQYNNAIAYADSAINLFDAIGHERKKLDILVHKADALFFLGDYTQSTAIALQLIEEAESKELRQTQRDAVELLMNNYNATGNYKKAFEYATRFYALEREMLNENSISEINRLKSEFDFERKELELESARSQTQILQFKLHEKNVYLIGLILMVVFGLVITWFILKQRRLAVQQKTAQLEHKALRTQMNPHFIFNSLNSIQRMYVEGNLDEANEFTGDFAELMRRILDNSNKNLVSLHEEIEVLNLYLSLENLRCKNMFDYTFDIGEELDLHRVMIPPLVVQPFVENAIWHGILPKGQHGQIHIEMRRENKYIRCVVSDTGAGIQKESVHFYESHGVRITEQRIGNKVSMESKPGAGTKVTFYILYQTA